MHLNGRQGSQDVNLPPQLTVTSIDVVFSEQKAIPLHHRERAERKAKTTD